MTGRLKICERHRIVCCRRSRIGRHVLSRRGTSMSTNPWRLVIQEAPPIDANVELSRDGKTRLDTICWTKYIASIANKTGLWWRFAQREEATECQI